MPLWVGETVLLWKTCLLGFTSDDCKCERCSNTTQHNTAQSAVIHAGAPGGRHGWKRPLAAVNSANLKRWRVQRWQRRCENTRAMGEQSKRRRGRETECNTNIFSKSIDDWVNVQLICFMIAGWAPRGEICMRVLQTEPRLNILFILRPEEVCRISLSVRACACAIPPARTSLKLPLRDTSSKGKCASFHKYGNKPAGTSRGKRTSSARAPKICALPMLLSH